jgi:hypothetical protein
VNIKKPRTLKTEGDPGKKISGAEEDFPTEGVYNPWLKGPGKLTGFGTGKGENLGLSIRKWDAGTRLRRSLS